MAAILAVAASDNWNSNGSWVGGVQPTAADDVTIVAGANVTIPTGVTALARSVTVAATGTLTFAAVSSILAIGDGTAGAGNVALSVSGTATITLTGVGTIQFLSTSATQQTITTGGKTMPSFTFNGAGSSYLQSDALLQSSTGTMIFQNGTYDTGNNAGSWGTTTLSTGTKTVTLGSSVITIIGGGLNFTTNNANFTLNSGTSSLVFTPTASVTPTFSMGSQTYYDASITKSAGGFTPTGSGTFHNFTMNNTVLGGGNRVLTFGNNQTITINGTFTYIGNNANSARGRLLSDLQGVQVTIALGTTGSVTLTNIDIDDMNFTGTAAPVSGTSLGDCGNGVGSTGVTFTTPVTRYWVGNGGNMSSTTHWSATSGGASGATVPLPHDTVIFDANSITSASQTITNDMMRFPGHDLTALLNTPIYNPVNPNGANNLIYGSLIFSAAVTYTCTGAAGGTTVMNFRGRGSYTLDHTGVTIPTNVGYTVAAPSGTYTLASDLLIDTHTFTINAGTFTANGFNISCLAVSSSGTGTRTINMGSGIWTVTGTGTVWNTTTTTNMSLDVGTSTLSIADTSSSNKTLIIGNGPPFSMHFWNITITGGGTGAIIFSNTGVRVFNSLVISSPKTVTFNQSATYTVSSFTAIGTAGNLITLQSSLGGTPAILSKASGIVSCDYLSITDSTATGGASFYAGANSTNVSGNSGWIFTAPPMGGAGLLMMGVG